MPFIEWTEHLTTGHDEIDDDHREILDLVNIVHDTLGKILDLGLFEIHMDALVKRTLSHFEREERLMLSFDYPERDEHTLKHRGLILQVRVFRTAIAEGMLDPAPGALQFLRDWLISHVVGNDLPLASFLLTQARSSTATAVMAPASPSRVRRSFR